MFLYAALQCDSKSGLSNSNTHSGGKMENLVQLKGRTVFQHTGKLGMGHKDVQANSKKVFFLQKSMSLNSKINAKIKCMH